MDRKYRIVFVFFLFSIFLKSQPSLLWVKNFGANLSESTSKITIDLSGNIYTTGYFSGTADFDPSASIYTLTSNGGSDIFISKYDPDGNFIWAKSIGSPSNDVGSSVSVDNNGNAYVCGYFSDVIDFDPGVGTATLSNVGFSDCFILKLDANGTYVWSFGFGDGSVDQANTTVIDGSNIYISGYYAGTVDFDPGPSPFSITTKSNSVDAFVLKLNLSGNFIWAKTFGGNNTDRISNMSLDVSGNIYLTGDFSGISDFDPSPNTYTLFAMGTNNNAFVSKLDQSGAFVWAKSFVGTSFDYGSSVKPDQFGNVYSCGTFGGNTDFDPGPSSFNLISGSGNSAYISKLDVSGNFLWAKSMNNYGGAKSLAVDNANNVYVAASFNGSIDLDPGAGTQTASSYGFSDAFILKLDQSGNYVWSACNQGTGADGIADILLDNSGNIYNTGTFFGTTDFDPSVGTFSLSSSNGGGIFIQILTPIPTGLNENDIIIENRLAYPNPANEIVNIISNQYDLDEIKVEIIDILGQIILTETVLTKVFNNSIDVSQFKTGVYFLKITSSGIQNIEKIIINH